ncbi:hypothetical protein LTR66_014350 [Elasticomyces elasticus]|nr:hypothetical protein LTR66_014350 [Elasticomyces elasticus]
MSQWLPKVRVADFASAAGHVFRDLANEYCIACNVAPVFLDTAKTVQKTVSLIREAAVAGRADLVVFPETYIPAFPLWVSGLALKVRRLSSFYALAHGFADLVVRFGWHKFSCRML